MKKIQIKLKYDWKEDLTTKYIIYMDIIQSIITSESYGWSAQSRMAKHSLFIMVFILFKIHQESFRQILNVHVDVIIALDHIAHLTAPFECPADERHGFKRQVQISVHQIHLN